MKLLRTLKKMGIKGLTLIEVLISLVILAIVLLASTSLMRIIQDQNFFNYHFTVASFLTQAKLEDLGNLSYFSAGLTPTDPNWIPALPGEILTATGQPSATGYYRRQWYIKGDDPSANKKRIKAHTQWTDRNNKVHQIELETVKSQY